MRGKISRGKQPRFAPVFRLFFRTRSFCSKEICGFAFFLAPAFAPPRLRLCGAGPARKKEEPPPLFSLLYILSTDTHRARFLHSAGYNNRAPENRSGARFLGRGGAALQVEHFAKWQNADSIGE